MTLGEALATAAGDLEPIAATEDGDATTWARDGHPFAVLAGDRLDLRLAPAIARAALATPDTHPSDRGGDWVRFAPRMVDSMALDRATAWFAAAWRHAAD